MKVNAGEATSLCAEPYVIVREVKKRKKADYEAELTKIAGAKVASAKPIFALRGMQGTDRTR